MLPGCDGNGELPVGIVGLSLGRCGSDGLGLYRLGGVLLFSFLGIRLLRFSVHNNVITIQRN